MNIKGIIFDLDGVICHTDSYHYLAWKAISDRFAIPFTPEINNRLRGVSRMESLEIILENSPHQFTDEEKLVIAEKKTRSTARSSQRLSQRTSQTKCVVRFLLCGKEGCTLPLAHRVKMQDIF